MFCIVMAMAETPEDRTKLEKLFNLYEKMMYRIAYGILNHHHDSEDAVITAWERIAANLDKILEIDCPQTKSFIVIIVERVAIDIYRRNSRIRNNEMSADKLEESPVILTKDQALEDVEMADVFRRLPKKYSEVMSYHYMNGMTMEEIAKLTDISVEAVKKRIQRGRAIIAKEMGIDE